MNVVVNGDVTPIATDATVGAMVDSLGKGRKGVAVAVNDEVVPRSRWDSTALRDHDRVEVLTASQGG